MKPTKATIQAVTKTAETPVLENPYLRGLSLAVKQAVIERLREGPIVPPDYSKLYLSPMAQAVRSALSMPNLWA